MRILKILTITLVSLTVIGVFSYLAFNTISSEMFRVEEIQVEGNEILTEDQIIKASGIKEGDNIFTLDLNKARYNISKILSTRSIHIKKYLPGKIVISIDEKEPIGVINDDDKVYYIDSGGNYMEDTEELGSDSVPIISGFGSYTFKNVGDPVEVEPAYKLEQVLTILKLFENSGLLDTLSEISLTPENTYRIITKNGVVFTVKDYENASEYFDYITTVIENGEINQDINFTAANNPIKKAR